IRAFCREANPDFSVEETAAASSLRRNRQTRLAPSPIGWPGNFRARASSRMRRRLSVKNFPASSASTKPSSVSGSIVVLLRTDTGFGSWSTFLVSENCPSDFGLQHCIVQRYFAPLLLSESRYSNRVVRCYLLHRREQWRKRTIGHGRTNPKSVAFSKPQEQLVKRLAEKCGPPPK